MGECESKEVEKASREFIDIRRKAVESFRNMFYARGL